MRLLNVNTLEFEEFYQTRTPVYAVLSHRWLSGHEEVSYKEFCKGYGKDKLGYQKVIDCCNFVQHRFARVENESAGWLLWDKFHWGPIKWVWIDTCCIDKRSSAELTEAINSMYSWYGNAEECYVYLADVPVADKSEAKLRQSDWFRRAWTLQELLAPALVVFCSADWGIIGHKCNHSGICRHPRDAYGHQLNSLVSSIAQIQEEYLRDCKRIPYASIARRMSWAARRKASREEDVAYALLGLYEVNMPMLYGEGTRAFRRLQEEIIKRSNDQSIFAWDDSNDASFELGLFADSPYLFETCGDIRRLPYGSRSPFALTNSGVQLLVTVQRPLKSQRSRKSKPEPQDLIVKLNCGRVVEPGNAKSLVQEEVVVHVFKEVDNAKDCYRAVFGASKKIKALPEDERENAELMTLFIEP